MEFCDRLKTVREKKGLTQKDVANLLNVERSTVCNYEKGTRQPNIETLKRMALMFEVTVDYLLGITESGAPKAHDPLAISFLTKLVTLDYPLDGDDSFQYLFSAEEYHELKEFLEKFDCVKEVRVNYGKDFDMTDVAAWIDFDYFTPHNEIKKIATKR